MSHRIRSASVLASAALFAGAAGISGVTAPPAAASAQASSALLPSAKGGYAWVDCDTTSCTPHPTWSYNTSGGAISSTRLSTGRYSVRFAGVGTPGGNVHVSAYGATAANCKVVSWYPSGGDQIVDASCFSPSGAPVDSRFTVNYTQPIGPGGQIAYAWADQPSAASYTPHRDYQYSNTGGVLTVKRTARGAYTVKVPRMASNPTSVAVTAYGPGNELCRVLHWTPSATSVTTQLVQVRCTTPAGTAADSRFVVSMTKQIGLMGNNLLANAAVWADVPTAPTYTPHTAYQWNISNAAGGQGALATIERPSTGRYHVTLPSQYPTASGGHVQVTSYGSGTKRCQVLAWGSSGGSAMLVEVVCTTRTGAPSDAMFTMQFQRTQ
jgi:hypothetical protein